MHTLLLSCQAEFTLCPSFLTGCDRQPRSCRTRRSVTYERPFEWGCCYEIKEPFDYSDHMCCNPRKSCWGHGSQCLLTQESISYVSGGLWQEGSLWGMGGGCRPREEAARDMLSSFFFIQQLLGARCHRRSWAYRPEADTVLPSQSSLPGR